MGGAAAATTSIALVSLSKGTRASSAGAALPSVDDALALALPLPVPAAVMKKYSAKGEIG